MFLREVQLFSLKIAILFRDAIKTLREYASDHIISLGVIASTVGAAGVVVWLRHPIMMRLHAVPKAIFEFALGH